MDNLSLRQHAIIERIHQQEYCSIDELAQQFDVTTQTIRRDINELCNLGLTRRHHGGVSLPATLSNRSYTSRRMTNAKDKHAIAERVVQHIPNGCTLFLGIGTTITAIAEQLGHHRELRVVTNNFEAAHILSQFEEVETWIPGGRIRSNDRDVVDDKVADFFAQFSADIGIIGCAAVSDIRSGLEEAEAAQYVMEHELREARVSQAILAHAEQRWLVANDSKWQRRANTKVAPLEYFDRIFKDSKQA